MASHDGNVSAAGQLECGHQRAGGTTPALGLLDLQHPDRPPPTAGPEHHHGLHAAVARDTSSVGTDLSATSLHTRHLGRLRQHRDREDLNGAMSPHRGPDVHRHHLLASPPAAPRGHLTPPPALKLPGGPPRHQSIEARGILNSSSPVNLRQPGRWSPSTSSLPASPAAKAHPPIQPPHRNQEPLTGLPLLCHLA